MALSATIHTFEVALNDADRGICVPLEFRVARHPSETAEYLVTRVLAYCLEYTEGLSFSKGGLSDPDAPALEIRDLTGARKAWIEVGLPEADRLHKAAKAAPRVAVYSYKAVGALVARLTTEAVHRATEIEIYALDPQVVSGLVARLERRMRVDLAVSDAHLYLSVGSETLIGPLTRHRPSDRPSKRHWG